MPDQDQDHDNVHVYNDTSVFLSFFLIYICVYILIRTFFHFFKFFFLHLACFTATHTVAYLISLLSNSLIHTHILSFLQLCSYTVRRMLHFVPAVPSPRSNKNITKNPSLLSSLFYRISDFESKFDRRSNSRAETKCPESELFFLQCRGSVDFSFFFFSFYRKSAIVAQCFRFACETMRDARKTSTYILFFFFFVQPLA